MIGRYKEVLIRMITIVASFASLVSLVLYYAPNPQILPLWALLAEIGAGILFIIILALELKSTRNLYSYRIGDLKGIKKYMHKWILNGGRVAIWTRDMSWADNEETKRLLLKKAQDGELLICAPREIQLMSELKNSGAEVLIYDLIELEPQSRFTIVQFGREGSCVAVGRRKGNKHIIEEFADGEHPAFSLADDLVKLARKIAELKKDDKK